MCIAWVARILSWTSCWSFWGIVCTLISKFDMSYVHTAMISYHSRFLFQITLKHLVLKDEVLSFDENWLKRRVQQEEEQDRKYLLQRWAEIIILSVERDTSQPDFFIQFQKQVSNCLIRSGADRIYHKSTFCAWT